MTVMTDPATSIITTQSEIEKYLKHFAVLAGLGAASVMLVALLQLVGTFNVSTLPLIWQGVVFLILPVVIAAGMKLKTEIDNEIAIQTATKKIAALQTKNAFLETKNAFLETKLVH